MRVLQPSNYLLSAGEAIPDPGTLEFYMPYDADINDDTGNYTGFTSSIVTGGQPGLYLSNSHKWGGQVAYAQFGSVSHVHFATSSADKAFTVFGVCEPISLSGGNLNLIFNKWRSGTSTEEYRMGVNTAGALFVQCKDSTNGGVITAKTVDSFASAGVKFTYSFTYTGSGDENGLTVFADGADVTSVRASGGTYDRMRRGTSAHSRVGDDRFGSNYGMIMYHENFGCWLDVAITAGQALTLHNDYLAAGVKLI